MEAVRRLRDAIILTLFLLSIFALIGLQLYEGTLLTKCVLRPATGVLRYATMSEKQAYYDARGTFVTTSDGFYSDRVFSVIVLKPVHLRAA